MRSFIRPTQLASFGFPLRVFPTKNDQVLAIAFTRDKPLWSTRIHMGRFTDHQLFPVEFVNRVFQEIDFASSGESCQPLWDLR